MPPKRRSRYGTDPDRVSAVEKNIPLFADAAEELTGKGNEIADASNKVQDYAKREKMLTDGTKNLVTAFTGLSPQLAAVVAGVTTLKGAYDLLIGTNEELNKSIIKSQSTFLTINNVYDATGAKINDIAQQFSATREKFRAVMKQIQIDTQELSGVTSLQTANIFQIVTTQMGQIAGQSKKYNDLDAARELTKSFTAAAGVLDLGPQQMQSEIRQLVEGRVNDPTAMLTRSLNINKRAFDAAAASGQKIDYILEKLNAYREANKQLTEQSVEGQASNILDEAQIIGLEIGKKAIEDLVKLMNQFYKYLKENKDSIIQAFEPIMKIFSRIGAILMEFLKFIGAALGLVVRETFKDMSTWGNTLTSVFDGMTRAAGFFVVRLTAVALAVEKVIAGLIMAISYAQQFTSAISGNGAKFKESIDELYIEPLNKSKTEMTVVTQTIISYENKKKTKGLSAEEEAGYQKARVRFAELYKSRKAFKDGAEQGDLNNLYGSDRLQYMDKLKDAYAPDAAALEKLNKEAGLRLEDLLDNTTTSVKPLESLGDLKQLVKDEYNVAKQGFDRRGGQIAQQFIEVTKEFIGKTTNAFQQGVISYDDAVRSYSEIATTGQVTLENRLAALKGLDDAQKAVMTGLQRSQENIELANKLAVEQGLIEEPTAAIRNNEAKKEVLDKQRQMLQKQLQLIRSIAPESQQAKIIQEEYNKVLLQMHQIDNDSTMQRINRHRLLADALNKEKQQILDIIQAVDKYRQTIEKRTAPSREAKVYSAQYEYKNSIKGLDNAKDALEAIMKEPKARSNAAIRERRGRLRDAQKAVVDSYNAVEAAKNDVMDSTADYFPAEAKAINEITEARTRAYVAQERLLNLSNSEISESLEDKYNEILAKDRNIAQLEKEERAIRESLSGPMTADKREQLERQLFNTREQISKQTRELIVSEQAYAAAVVDASQQRIKAYQDYQNAIFEQKQLQKEISSAEKPTNAEAKRDELDRQRENRIQKQNQLRERNANLLSQLVSQWDNLTDEKRQALYTELENNNKEQLQITKELVIAERNKANELLKINLELIGSEIKLNDAMRQRQAIIDKLDYTKSRDANTITEGQYLDVRDKTRAAINNSKKQLVELDKTINSKAFDNLPIETQRDIYAQRESALAVQDSAEQEMFDAELRRDQQRRQNTFEAYNLEVNIIKARIAGSSYITSETQKQREQMMISKAELNTLQDNLNYLLSAKNSFATTQEWEAAVVGTQEKIGQGFRNLNDQQQQFSDKLRMLNFNVITASLNTQAAAIDRTISLSKAHNQTIEARVKLEESLRNIRISEMEYYNNERSLKAERVSRAEKLVKITEDKDTSPEEKAEANRQLQNAGYAGRSALDLARERLRIEETIARTQLEIAKMKMQMERESFTLNQQRLKIELQMKQIANERSLIDSKIELARANKQIELINDNRTLSDEDRAAKMIDAVAARDKALGGVVAGEAEQRSLFELGSIALQQSQADAKSLQLQQQTQMNDMMQKANTKSLDNRLELAKLGGNPSDIGVVGIGRINIDLAAAVAPMTTQLQTMTAINQQSLSQLQQLNGLISAQLNRGNKPINVSVNVPQTFTKVGNQNAVMRQLGL